MYVKNKHIIIRKQEEKIINKLLEKHKNNKKINSIIVTHPQILKRLKEKSRQILKTKDYYRIYEKELKELFGIDINYHLFFYLFKKYIKGKNNECLTDNKQTND